SRREDGWSIRLWPPGTKAESKRRRARFIPEGEESGRRRDFSHRPSNRPAASSSAGIAAASGKLIRRKRIAMRQRARTQRKPAAPPEKPPPNDAGAGHFRSTYVPSKPHP